MIPHIPERKFDSAHHPSDEEMIDYLCGRLEEIASDNLRAHLVECDICLVSHKDARDFFEAQRENEPAIKEDIAEQWKAFCERINVDEKETRHQLPDQLPERPVGFRINLAMGVVAALVLLTVAIGIWALRQRREKQDLVNQLSAVQQRAQDLENEQAKLAARFKELESEREFEKSKSLDQPDIVHPSPASWSTNRADAFRALQIEGTRDEMEVVDLSRPEAQLLVSLRRYDDTGQAYSRYRISLETGGKPVWRQVLSAPKVALTRNAHILKLVFLGLQLRDSGQYVLRIDGWTTGDWQRLGDTPLSIKVR